MKYVIMFGYTALFLGLIYGLWFHICLRSGWFYLCPGVTAYVTSMPKPEEIVILGPYDEVGTIRPWRVLHFIHTITFTYQDEFVRVHSLGRGDAILRVHWLQREWCHRMWLVERNCGTHGPVYLEAMNNTSKIIKDLLRSK